jgi:hypothetical protein
MAKADHQFFVRIFGSSASFLALSTIKTMSGRLRTTPESPIDPFYIIIDACDRQRLCISGQFGHQNH